MAIGIRIDVMPARRQMPQETERRVRDGASFLSTRHDEAMTDDNGRTTWVLVDGENIDATLGMSILNRRPQSEERPRWDRLIDFVQRQWSQQARGVFFLNASAGIPAGFAQALKSMNYVVVPLTGTHDQKVVDIAIQRTLAALLERDDDIMLLSHDGDFVPDVEQLAGGGRRVGVVGFSEFLSAQLVSIRGVETFDLEDDAKVFDAPLPRLRAIPIDLFDPRSFLR